MNLSVYSSINLPSVLKRFDLQSKNFIIKPNFTQVCAGTTDTNSLDQVCKTLSEQPIEPKIQLVEIPNVNAPPLRQVIRELDVVDTLNKYGVRIVYLDELSLSEYGKFSSFHIPNLFLQRCEERLIVITPPKEHKFLSGGIEISALTPYLDGYSGVMKNLAVGIIHKNDMRKTHGVSKVIVEKYETENLRFLWSIMTEEEKMVIKENHNRIINQIIERVIKPKDIFILTNRGMLRDHIKGMPVKIDCWVIGNDPRKVDELGVQLLIEAKKDSRL